jgi:uncharacterized protein
VDDRELVERQLGRPPRAFRGVAVRCPYGAPAVTEQTPYDERGEPFPTTYYLTCPHAVAAVARVEAAGGVERWSAEVARDRALASSLELGNEQQRLLRRGLARGGSSPDGGAALDLGIGGAGRRAGGLKCLHAHAAFALARPGYELGERIVDEAGPLWPAEGCCTLAGGHYHRASMPVSVDSIRHEWEEGNRRLEATARDRTRYLRLLEQVDVLTDELSRRVGQTFTLSQLADVYADAERWSRHAIAERAPSPDWPATLSLVEDATFHRYQRGAVDYEP